VPAFHPDVATALAGPEWLVARRNAAAELFASAPMPTAEDEVWRYSRIGKLDLARYRPSSASPPADPSSTGLADLLARTTAHLPTVRSATVLTVDGHVSRIDVEPSAAAALTISGPTDADQLGALEAAVDVFATANDAYSDPVVISVRAANSVTAPVVVVHLVSADGAAVFPRLVLDAAPGSAVSVIEVFASADVDALVAPVAQLRAGRDARVHYAALQILGPRVWQVATMTGEADAQAHLAASVAAFGGAYARQRSDARLAGRGATGELVSLYFGDDDQMLDFRTFQDHAAPDCTSDLLFKGAVDGRSHSVYTGLIRVRPDARGTNAYQTNRNIKLSDDAWAESVPNLEIENNDVRCSHASTVGPLDPDQRFYLESRGVPPDAAERLIVAGFFGEVLERLAVPELVPAVREHLNRRIAAVSPTAEVAV